MLVVRDVWKSYRGPRRAKTVLRGASFQLKAGQALGILGHPGTGKSTLIKLLSGADHPDRGSVNANGSVSWPVGFKGWFARPLTAEENLRFIASLYGNDVDRTVDHAREFAGVAGREWFRPWKDVDGIVRRRIAMAASFSIPFDVYLVEGNPLGGPKPFRKRCLDAFAERLEHAAMVLVARKPQQLQQLATHYAVLKKGRIRRFPSRERALEHFNKEAA